LLEKEGNGVGQLVRLRLVERIHLVGYAERMVAKFVLQLKNMLMVRMHCVLMAPCLGSQRYFFLIQRTEAREHCTTATMVMPMLRSLKNLSKK
jgi:hypothetical protein